MSKLLLFLVVALVANTFLIVTATDTGAKSEAHSSSSSSSTSSSSTSSSESSSESSSSSTSSNQDKQQKPPKQPVDDCGETEPNNYECKANEEYVECPDYTCRPKYCSEVGFPVACPDQAPNSTCPTKPACICIEGYVRTKKGICIPEKDCPSCGGDKNAQAGCGINCGRHCSNYKNKNVFCPAICLYNACDCKPNYVYDDQTKNCVLPKDCTPICGDNEVYSNCTNGGCYGARKCCEIGQPIKCVKLAAKDCEKGCICKDKYLRNATGACVPQNQCPLTCSNPNEVYDECPAVCPPQRCGVDPRVIRCRENPKVGDPECQPGCRCADGYVKNDQEVCVTRDECPIKCGENEIYSDCTNGGCYGAKNCSEIGKPVKCVKLAAGSCKKGCLCQDGYLRNQEGVCVPQDQCPGNKTCSNPNEEYDECPAICPPQRCGVDPRVVKCGPNPEVGDPKCKPGCRCIKGTVRNDQEVCVAREECPPPCGINEEYSDCINGGCYSARRCSEIGEPVKCAKIPVGSCKIGCLCKEGTLRNEDGLCIDQDQCPPTKNCYNQNEVYDECPPTCPPQECGVNPAVILCQPNPKVGDPECQPGCRCADGYVKNDQGICVSPDQCPVCGTNEVYSSCANGGCYGPRNCSQIGGPTICVDLIQGGCRGACLCVEGYLRNDENGLCVTPDQCPNTNSTTQCPGSHEVYDSCPTGCSPGTCESIGKAYNCPLETDDKSSCKGACVCEKGYFRNYLGDCISEEDCLKCSGPNEYYACGSACDNVCTDLATQNQTNCPIKNKTCNKRCYCKEGYARDSNNTCIPIEKCPATQECNRPNEEYNSCPMSCPPNTCESIGQTYPCPKRPTRIEDCHGACVCKEGFYKNAIGDCISEEDCLKCTGPNEFFSCGGACDNVCATLDKQNQTNCPIVNIVCNKMCYCKDGYARDNNNTCIPIDQCPEKTTGCNGDPNAHSGCCGKFCYNYDSTKPVVCNKLCIIGACACNDGYALDSNTGMCVLPEQCTPQCTGDNEFYDSCPPSCSPETCESIGKEYHCPIQTTVCKPACRCQSGYYRNSEGTCIPKNECNQTTTSCNGDPNAHSGCGVNCGRLCSNYNSTQPIACPDICKVNGCDCNDGYVFDSSTGLCVLPEQCKTTACNGDVNAHPGCGVNCGRLCSNYNSTEGVSCIDICYENGCDCNDGYVLDTNTGQCVLPEQCSPACGDNEQYSTCIQSICRNQNCTQRGQSVACVRIDPKYCIKGCVCSEKYLRNSKGQCVPENQCDTCPEGEVFNTCPAKKCDADYCPKSRDSPTACQSTKNCDEPRCTCGFNMKRDRTSCKCIATADCPPFKCDKPNEEYNSCPPVCPGQNCSDYINNSTCPKYRIGIVVPCTPACRCKKNYYRDSKGNCVTGKQCEKEANTKPTTTTSTTCAPSKTTKPADCDD